MVCHYHSKNDMDTTRLPKANSTRRDLLLSVPPPLSRKASDKKPQEIAISLRAN